MRVHHEDYIFAVHVMKFMMVERQEWRPQLMRLLRGGEPPFTISIREKMRHTIALNHFHVKYNLWFARRDETYENFKLLAEIYTAEFSKNNYNEEDFIHYCVEIATIAHCGYLKDISEAPDYAIVCIVHVLQLYRDRGELMDAVYLRMDEWARLYMCNIEKHSFPSPVYSRDSESSSSPRETSSSGFNSESSNHSLLQVSSSDSENPPDESNINEDPVNFEVRDDVGRENRTSENETEDKSVDQLNLVNSCGIPQRRKADEEINLANMHLSEKSPTCTKPPPLKRLKSNPGCEESSSLEGCSHTQNDMTNENISKDTPTGNVMFGCLNPEQTSSTKRKISISEDVSLKTSGVITNLRPLKRLNSGCKTFKDDGTIKELGVVHVDDTDVTENKTLIDESEVRSVSQMTTATNNTNQTTKKKHCF